MPASPPAPIPLEIWPVLTLAYTATSHTALQLPRSSLVTRAPGSWPQLTVGLCSADPSAGSTLPACSFPHKALGLFQQEEPFHRVLAAWTPSSGNHTPLASQPCGHPPVPNLSTLPEMEHLVGAADRQQRRRQP